MSASSSWTAQQVLALIEVYKNHQLLYELKNPLYHHKTARREALESITECVKGVRPDTTPDEVKVKLNSLRTQFNRQIATIKNKQRAGNVNYRGNLWCFEQLKFLEDYVVTRRPRMSNHDHMLPSRTGPVTAESSLLQAPQETRVKIETSSQTADENNNAEEIEEEEPFEAPVNYCQLQVDHPSSPLPSNNNNKKRNSLRRKFDDELIDKSLRINHEPDPERLSVEWNNFGEFVSLEMQNLVSTKRKRMCKREMITILMKYQQEEDNQFD